MPAQRLRLGVLAVVVVGALMGRAEATPFYGVSFSRQLFSINQVTGAGTLIGSVGTATTLPSDLASFGGNLYVYDETDPDTFLRIDPATAGTLGSTTSGVDVVGEGGFSFRSDGRAFVTGSSGSTGTLYNCNATINSGCATVGGIDPSMDALAFSLGGALYGLSQSPVGTAQPSLYLINQITAATSLIGATGVGGVNVAGMAVDPVSGVLYAAIGRSLYTINTVTGAATFVGVTGFDQVSGIAFLPATVPEPATLGLLAVGLAAAAAARRRRSR